MNKILWIFLIAMIFSNPIFSQTQITDANFRVFDAKGNASSLGSIIEALAQTDVVFLGEQHDDAVGHFLEAEIFKRAFERYGNSRRLVLSMEMFERDTQSILDEYLADIINEANFISSARAWGNYKTDYKPLIEFAKANRLPVVAANAPRRYVNRVSRLGRNSLDILPGNVKEWLAPLPFADSSEAYANKFRNLMSAGGGGAPAHISQQNILDSQTLWDATMADSISHALKRNKHALIVHLNGSFHSENRLGAPEHLAKYSRKARFLVVTIRYDESFPNFEKSRNENLGDFVIVTDPKIPRTKR